MNKKYKIVSKYTNNVGFVINITSSKIFVSFVDNDNFCIGYNLKNFKNDFIVEKSDFKEIKSIRKIKVEEKRKEKEKKAAKSETCGYIAADSTDNGYIDNANISKCSIKSFEFNKEYINLALMGRANNLIGVRF